MAKQKKSLNELFEQSRRIMYGDGSTDYRKVNAAFTQDKYANNIYKSVAYKKAMDKINKLKKTDRAKSDALFDKLRNRRFSQRTYMGLSKG